MSKQTLAASGRPRNRSGFDSCGHAPAQRPSPDSARHPSPGSWAHGPRIRTCKQLAPNRSHQSHRRSEHIPGSRANRAIGHAPHCRAHRNGLVRARAHVSADSGVRPNVSECVLLPLASDTAAVPTPTTVPSQDDSPPARKQQGSTRSPCRMCVSSPSKQTTTAEYSDAVGPLPCSRSRGSPGTRASRRGDTDQPPAVAIPST
eukprot:1739691-Pyramimonas_sp.AAC.1